MSSYQKSLALADRRLAFNLNAINEDNPDYDKLVQNCEKQFEREIKQIEDWKREESQFTYFCP